MEKILKSLVNCFIVFFIICALFLLFFNFSSKRDSITKLGKYSILDVNGNSMYPKIKNGDLIVIDIEYKDMYEEGDIVTFVDTRNNIELLVTHEIVDVIDDYDSYKYVTKGLNNDENDNLLLNHNEIIGKYKGFRIPLVGYVIRFSRTMLGYWLLVVTPLGIVSVLAVYELIKELSKKKGEC